jgi:cystathionine beta-lyase
MVYNFDEIIDRRHSNSLKWSVYPEDVIPMWVADMDFRAPNEILEAIKKRLDHGIFGYQSEMKEARDVLVDWAYVHYQWTIKPEDILFVPGIVPGLNFAAQALSMSGDGILIQPPVYPPFFMVAKFANLSLQEAPLRVRENLYYSIDFDEFEQAINISTRLFILCNPHNPVGRMFTKNELMKLSQICLQHHIIILSDEIHCDLTYNDRHHIPIASLHPEIAQNVVTFMAPSKTFNIAGLKCSMIIVQNPELRHKLEHSRRGLVEEPNILSLTAGWAAYKYGQPYLKELLTYLQGNRDYIVNFFKHKIPALKLSQPEATFLAWLDCHTLNLTPNPYEYFLREAKVALNDGRAFGTNGNEFVRLNFGCPRSILIEALNRIHKSIPTL